jgi:hypothetical protein
VPDVIEILVEEGLAQASSGIGQLRLDRPPSRRDIELVDTFDRGEISLNGVHLYAQRTEIVRRIGDGRFVGDDQKVEAILGTLPGELVSDAARGAGDDCEGTAV